MTRLRFGTVAVLGALLLPALSNCGGGDLTLPVPPDASDFQISPIGATDRSGRVGEILNDGLTVEVRDPDGKPAEGFDVAFSLPDGGAAGALIPDTASTDDRGLATTDWRLGKRTGTFLAQARLVAPGVDDLPVAEFRVSIAAGPPDSLRAVSALAQTGRRNQELVDPLVVAVVDRYGNPVPNVNVAWQIERGEGTLSDSLVATDASGQSSVRWTLGGRNGVQEASASVAGLSGSPVSFGVVILF